MSEGPPSSRLDEPADEAALAEPAEPGAPTPRSVDRGRAGRFVDWTLRYGRWIWAIAILLAIPATWRSAQLYLHLKSELEELLPRESPSVRALDELRNRFPGLQYLGVVVDFGDEGRQADGDRFVDQLTARIRTYPLELVRGVRTGTEEERAFLESHAPLYTELSDLETIRQRIEARRDYEVGRETDLAIDLTGEPPSLDFGDIQNKYEAKLPKRGMADGDRYSSKKLHLSMLLVEVGFESGTSRGKHLLARVRSDVQDLQATVPAFRSMRVGYASDVAIAVEELDSLISDLSVSSILVLVLVVSVLILYYRWRRSVLILVPPLLMATAYAFALASLPPLGVTSLNSNTAFLGSIIVGNGINFGIVLLARYVEERRRCEDTRIALITAVGAARTGTLSAAIAASVAYGSLVSTQFRGFRQFGIIGGLGMVLSWAVAFVCMPPLIHWLDRGRHSCERVKPSALDGAVGRRPVFERLARFVQRHAAIVAAAGAVVTLLAIAKVCTFGPDELEYDLSKLRRRDTMVRGEGYWGARMDMLLGRYLTPTVLITDTQEQARAVSQQLHESARAAPLSEMVSDIRTLDDVLPLDQPAKIASAQAIREALTPKIRALIAPEKRDQIDRLLGSEDLTPVTLRDLPHTFTIGLVEWDGTAGRSVLMFPRSSQGLWDGPTLVNFVSALRDVGRAAGLHPARVAGALPLSADIFSSLRRDGFRTSILAFTGVLAVVLVMFRRQQTTAYVIGSLTGAVLCLLAALMVLGVKINFANFIAFPITFGIGVDYAVNVMSRYTQGSKRDMVTAVAATGSAVALCSATTIIGYSSLLVAQNRALFLFGLVAVLGEISCLSSAITFLPAVVRLVATRSVRERRGETSAGPASGPASEPSSGPVSGPVSGPSRT
jgi:predicted RND superfamily exporter protein